MTPKQIAYVIVSRLIRRSDDPRSVTIQEKADAPTIYVSPEHWENLVSGRGPLPDVIEVSSAIADEVTALLRVVGIARVVEDGPAVRDEGSQEPVLAARARILNKLVARARSILQPTSHDWDAGTIRKDPHPSKAQIDLVCDDGAGETRLLAEDVEGDLVDFVLEARDLLIELAKLDV